MAEDTDKKVAPKMVREQDLMAQKKAKEKALEELAEEKRKTARLEHELKVAKTDAEDEDEVLAIKEALKNQFDEIQQERAKFQTELTAFEGEKKASRLQALASEHGVEIDSIKDAEDPEKEALRLKLERIAGKMAEAPSPESVVEHAPAGGIIKKMPLDMSDKEFADYETQKKAEYYKKK